jgi:glycolate oxidase
MSFKTLTPEVLEQLKAAVPGRVLAGADIVEDYAHDEMPYNGTRMPDAVVVATTTEEVAAACKVCYDNDIPIIPRGAGTGLSGGCVALHGGVIIDITKMNKILSWELDNFIVRVEAGVLLNDLATACTERGVMYPPDPGEVYATLGGNVAVNAGGMRAVKYGCTREYVKAMTVVLPDGRIVHFGAETTKNASGYSLENLMVGSEGTLGIITELSLKVIPQPKFTVSLLGLYAELPECISSVSKVKLAGLDPQALEFMPRRNVEMSEEFLGKTVFPAKADGQDVGFYLLCTIDCNHEEEMEETMEAAAEVLMENGALDVVVYDTPQALRDGWAVRKASLEGMQMRYNIMDECDIVVPLPHLAEYIEYIATLEEKIGLDICYIGHAGDGNCHVNICGNDVPHDVFDAKAEEFMALAFAKGKEYGAVISGEHGIGHLRVKALENSCGEDVMDLMRGIKAAFDPKGLLNPGKVCTYVHD